MPILARLTLCLITLTASSFTASAQAPLATPVAATLTAPFRAGAHYFFTASDGALYVRDGAQGSARVLLAANSFSVLAPSPDGRYLAYGTPNNGAESYQVRIRDVMTGRDMSQVLEQGAISRAPWTANNKGFFYAREDTTDHRERVYYHRLDQAQDRDEIIFSQQDSPDWRYNVRVSDDGQYAVFTVSHSADDHTRIFFIDLDNPGKPTLNAPVVRLVDEFDARYQFIDNGGNAFFLQTNRQAPHGRIVLANTDNTRESRWPAILQESADTLTFAQTAGEQYVVAAYRNDTTFKVRVLTFPDRRTIEAEIRRRADSVRKSHPDGYMPDNRGVMPPPVGLNDAFAWHLTIRREVPLPSKSRVLDMHSVADQDELYYIVRTTDGNVEAYTYNVKTGKNRPFDMSH